MDDTKLGMSNHTLLYSIGLDKFLQTYRAISMMAININDIRTAASMSTIDNSNSNSDDNTSDNQQTSTARVQCSTGNKEMSANS